MLSTLMFATVNFGVLILIWLVQLIIYPSMRYWDKESFSQSHPWYTKSITPFIILLMVPQALLAGRELITVPSTLLLLQILAITSAWLTTFFISVPLHKKLSRGFDKVKIERLIRTNWYRTGAWSFVCLLDLLKITL